FFTALIFAFIFAILFHGVQQWLELLIDGVNAALVTTVFVASFIVAPTILLIFTLIRNETPLRADSKHLGLSVPPQLQRFFHTVRSRIPPSALEPHARAFIAGFLASLGNLAAMLFGLFFMLRDGQVMSRRLRDALPFTPDESERLIGDTREMIVAS